VQRAGMQPIQDQLEQRIIEPLKLDSLQLDLPAANQPHWAKGYRRSQAGLVVAVPDTAHFWKHGAGGYKSSISDFARWAEALLNHELVGAQAEQAMWTAQPRNDGKATSYGLGFSVSGRGANFKVSHTGSQDETRTILVIYPQRRMGMVVMSNCNFANTARLAAALEKVL